MKPVLLSAAAALLLTGAAVAQPVNPPPAVKASPPAQQCFFANLVNNFKEVDDHTVDLRVGVNDFYQVTLMGTCDELKWAQAIGLDHRGSPTICTGLDLTLIVPRHPMPPERCPATSIRKLTPEEVAAMPKGQKP